MSVKQLKENELRKIFTTNVQNTPRMTNVDKGSSELNVIQQLVQYTVLKLCLLALK